MLDPLEQIAVAYAPCAARSAWEGLLLLERKLNDAARPGRDPLMIQLRLSWWRDRFAEPVAAWPAGEPLLALLAAWDAERAALVALVDGWEAKIVGDDAGAELARAREGALIALGRLVGADAPETIAVAAADLYHPGTAGPAPRLPRAMRPLAVLRGLTVREARGGKPLSGWAAMLLTMRLGMFGR